MTHKKPTHIYKRDGTLVPFDQTKITNAIYKAAAAVGGHNRSLSEKLSDEVVQFLVERFPDTIPTVEDIQDIVEKVLIENGHAKTAKAYILYRQMRAEMRKKRAERKKDENIPYRILWQTLSWNIDHNCATVDQLNEHVRGGTFPELVRAADQAYEESVAQAADAIASRSDNVRLVIIAGPSSSGKTTTTIKLSQRLKERNLQLVALNVDNYFFDLELHPKDEYGDYDFETPEAIDINLLNEHLAALIKGREVKLPVFDFKSGKRIDNAVPISIHENQIILIDTLHGLYEDLTRAVPDEAKFKLYIETFSQLKDKNKQFTRWADIRMMRRMARDRVHRNFDPTRTVGHWHYVRRSELKHIIPYIHTADYILNGALPYELPVLKKHLFHLFPSIIEHYAKDPARQDAFIRATRVHTLLESIEKVEDDSCIPPESLLREFIGGSSHNH